MTKTKTRKARKKEKKGRGVFFYLFLIILFSLLAWSYRALEDYLHERLARFELEDIQFRGNHVLGDEELLKRLGFVDEETRLLEIKPKQVEERLKDLPYVRTVHAVHSLPSTLRIVLHEREPLAFLLGRGLNLVDDEGFILPVPQKSLHWDLPVICGINENLGVQGAYTVSQEVQKAVKIAAYVRLMPLPLPELVSEIDMSERGFVQLLLKNGKTRIRVERKAYQEQLFKAALYLQEYMDYKTIDKIKYVDVRFAGQVVIGEYRG